MKWLSKLLGVPKSPLVVDFAYSFAKEPEVWQEMVAQKRIQAAAARPLERYIANRKNRKPAHLIVKRDAAGRHSYFLNLEPLAVLTLEVFPDWNFFYANSICLPENSRVFYEAGLGNLPQFNVEDLLSFVVLDSQQSLQTLCHRCAGKGKLPCKRCQGSGWVRSKRGKRYRCSSEGCRFGKKKCFSCQSKKRRDVKIFRENSQLTLGFSGKGVAPDTMFARGATLRRGQIEAILQLRKQSRKPTPVSVSSNSSDYLNAGEESFEKLLQECERALEVEEQVSRESANTSDEEEQKRAVWPHTVCREALTFWRKADTLQNPVKRMLCVPTEKKHAPETKKIRYFNSQLETNHSQAQAVELVLSKRYPITSIQGPPGTGKTSVICEIVQQELKTPGKILVISQSNLAVDNVLEKLLDDVSVIRIGRRERVTEAIQPVLLNELINGIETPNSFWGQISSVFNNLFGRKANRLSYAELYDSTRVIGATCIGSNHPFLKNRHTVYSKEKVKLIIIDEAGRCPVLEALVPIQFGPRVVLVGDHKQLPPTVVSEVRQGWDKRYPEQSTENHPGFASVFQTVCNRLPEESNVVLTTQYRMHPQIGEFIKEVFYKNEGLTHGVSSAERSLPLAGFPEALSYHDTSIFGQQQFETKSENSNSKQNLAEAGLVIELLGRLNAEASLKGCSVGVISFYQGQVDLIQHYLKNCSFDTLGFSPESDISTLDSYQGKEKDVIILSLVRCPQRAAKFDASWYRFFLDVRRLNVALSRARKRLLIVGNIEQILQVSKNRSSVPGFEVLERLKDYIDHHDLAVPFDACQ